MSEKKEKAPPSRSAGVKPLASLVSSQMQEASKAWAEILHVAVTTDRAKAQEVPAEGLGKVLPWPLAAVAVTLEGGIQGVFLVLLKPEHAALFRDLGLGSPPQEGAVAALDPVTAESLGKWMAPLCAATARTFLGKREPAPTATAGPPALLKDAAWVAGTGVALDGWLVSATLAAGDHKGIPVWQLLPLAMGTALVDDFRKRGDDAAPGADAKAPAPKGKVLVVDDQHSIRTLIKRHLEQDGYEAVLATSGEEALKQLKKWKPVAVVLDVMMPGMDGFEVCRRLRAMPDGGSVPVVMCTGKGQRQDVVEAVQAGASDYVVKPFTRDILLTKVAKAIEAAGRKQA
jgi:CheY-like chemotaxis protein